MIDAGTLERERFNAAMDRVAVGATLVRGKRPWVVVKQKQRETSVDLTLRSGRRELMVPVMVCHSGPALWEVGLSVVAPAPVQRGLFGGANHG